MSLYYQDDFVTLYHGDSLEILPTLDIQATALLTDPPYFKVKKDAWDNQWGGASEFLSWMGEWLDAGRSHLTGNASVWVFASPQMTSSVERVVGERFRVLNSIRWVKEAGWHQKAELASLRSYLTPWEGIIFAEQLVDEHSIAAKALHKQVFAPLGNYIQTERVRAGWDANELEIALGFIRKANPMRGTELVRRWEEGASLPTADSYGRMRDILNADGGSYLMREHSDLRQEFEYLRAEFEDQRKALDDARRPFVIPERSLSTDVWTFRPVAPYHGKHPCEKPAEMLQHMVSVSTREDDLVLDPFAGSGSTLEAARNLGRRAIGIEQDERWCEQIANRLSQGTLEMEEVA
jgi:site-specific DNA-methyltransferase (adenine-specific)